MGLVDYIFLALIVAIVTLLVLKFKPEQDKKDININVYTDNGTGNLKADDNTTNAEVKTTNTRPREIPIETPKKKVTDWRDIKITDSFDG